MRSYTIAKTCGAPDWQNIPALDIDTPLWGTNTDIRAGAQLCWDESALHVRLWAKEKHIRAEYRGVLDMPCEDSCLEFFFAPTEDGRYFNIEYNPNASLFLGIGHNRNEYVRLVLTEPYSFAPVTERTADGWAVTYRIPFEFVRLFFPDFRPAAGQAIRANCYKCGDLTPQEHYLSWNPVECVQPDFHRPDFFGSMTFGA